MNPTGHGPGSQTRPIRPGLSSQAGNGRRSRIRLARAFERPIPWVIALLAAILRLSSLDLIEFKGDEVRHLANALEMIRQGRLPLVGTQSSVGVAKPPMMTYLMALPTALGSDPRIASGFIALLNVAAVVGLFLLAKRYYGWRVAAIASMLFAANPWAVILSRKVFTADVLAPMAVLVLYGLCLALVDRRPVGIALSIVALSAMLNTTFSPWPLLVIVLVLLALYRQRVSWPYVAAGCLLGLVVSIPYLIYQAAHGLADVRLLWHAVKAAASGESTAPFALASVALPAQYAVWLHSGLNLGALAGAAFDRFAPAHSFLLVLDHLSAGAFLGALVAVPALIWRSRARSIRSDASPLVIVGLWLWVPILLFPLQPGAMEMHYLVILYPVGFLAMGVSLDRLLRWARGAAVAFRWRSLLHWAVAGTLLAIVASHSYTVMYLYTFVAQHETSYGTPFRFWSQVVQMVRLAARSATTDQVWVVANGSDITYEEEPSILSYLLAPDVQAAFLGQGGNECLLLPAGRPGVYLLTRPAPRVEEALSQLGAVERGAVRFPGAQHPARLFFAESHSAQQLLGTVRHGDPLVCDAGVRLVGYDWPADARAGQTLSLRTYWTFADASRIERNVQHSAFNHLLAPDGDKLAQHDGFGLPERYWAEGLLLVQWADLALPKDTPAADYVLLTGMYRLSDYSRNRWADEQGHDLGDGITLGPIRVTR